MFTIAPSFSRALVSLYATGGLGVDTGGDPYLARGRVQLRPRKAPEHVRRGQERDCGKLMVLGS